MSTISDLATILRAAIDRKEELNQLVKEQSQIIDECEFAICKMMDEQGIEKTTASGMSLSRVSKPRATYVPDKWESVMKWCVENGHEYLIQRRLTDKKVEGLIVAGVELPEGLGLEYVDELSTRRV